MFRAENSSIDSENKLSKSVMKQHKTRNRLAALALAPVVLLGQNPDAVDSDVCSPQNKIEISTGVFVAKKLSKDNIYEATYFGCAKGFKDDRDDCGAAYEGKVQACNDPAKNIKLEGRACQERLIWGAANADQFLTKADLAPGAMIKTKLMVTNIANGESVVVVPFDKGPNCNVQDKHARFDLLLNAYDAIKLPHKDAKDKHPNGFVKVVRVPDGTPLGFVK